MAQTNTLAYYDTATIMFVKSFLVLARQGQIRPDQARPDETKIETETLDITRLRFWLFWRFFFCKPDRLNGIEKECTIMKRSGFQKE